MEITAAALWKDFVTFGERPSPQTMVENERVRVIIAGLKAGQRIPLHPEAAAVYTIMEGTGVMTVDGEDFAVQPGSVIVMDQDARRGLLAETQLVFMAVRLA